MFGEEIEVDSIILGSDPSMYQVEYTPMPSVTNFHSLPRFSRSNDFSLLFSTNPEEVREYSLGLMFLAILIICCFVTWALALLILKCIGPKYVGVFSGYPFQKEGCKATTGRSILAFSSLMIIILAIIMGTKGLAELQYASDTVEMTNQDVIKIHDELVTLTANMKNVSRRATPIRDQLVTILEQDICPSRPGTATESTVRDVGNNTLHGLQQLDNFLADDIKQIDTALAQVQHTTIQINQVVSHTQFTGPQVTAMMFPFFVVPAFVLVAVLMGWFDVFSEGYYTIMTWFIIPLMSLMTAFAFFAAGWILVATQGNSDFCYDPPDNIQRILARYGMEQGQQLYYDVAMFYSHQCTTTTTSNPWTLMEVFYGQLQQAESSLESFLMLVLEQSPEQLSQQCGLDYSPVMELLNALKVHSTILRSTSTRALQLLSCPSIVPLYTSSVYNGLCQSSLVGAKYVFSCLLLIAFFGMLSTMFRGSFYPIDYFFFNDDDDDDDDEGKNSMYSTSQDDEYEEEHVVEQEDDAYDVDAVGESHEETYEDMGESLVDTVDESAIKRYGDMKLGATAEA